MTKPSRIPSVRRAKAADKAFKRGTLVRVEYDDSEAADAVDAVVEAALRATRPAAQAAAQLLYDEAKLRCPVSTEEHVFYGKNSKKSGVTYTFQPGNLRASIYQAFAKDRSSEFGDGYRKATYHVAWNHKTAPYGFMVELGTSRAAARPFLRPAYEARLADALAAARGTFAARLKTDVPGFK